MEREMCAHLGWHLSVDPLELAAFTQRIQRELGFHLGEIGGVSKVLPVALSITMTPATDTPQGQSPPEKVPKRAQLVVASRPRLLSNAPSCTTVDGAHWAAPFEYPSAALVAAAAAVEHAGANDEGKGEIYLEPSFNRGPQPNAQATTTATDSDRLDELLIYETDGVEIWFQNPPQSMEVTRGRHKSIE